MRLTSSLRKIQNEEVLPFPGVIIKLMDPKKPYLTNPQKPSINHDTWDLEIQASAAYTQLIHLQLPRDLKGKNMMGKRINSIFSVTFACQ